MNEKVGVRQNDKERGDNTMREGKNIYKIERNGEIFLEEVRNKLETVRILSEVGDERREVETTWEGEGRAGMKPRGCNW